MARTAQRDRAEALLREGLADLPEAPQYTLDRIDCLRSASGAARMMGNAAAAVQRAEAAHALAGTLEIPSTVLEMRLWLDLAESYRVAGRFAEADPAFAAAFDRLKALGRENTQTAGTLLNNWGVLLGQTASRCGRKRFCIRRWRSAAAILHSAKCRRCCWSTTPERSLSSAASMQHPSTRIGRTSKRAAPATRSS